MHSSPSATGPRGQIADNRAITHLERLELQFYNLDDQAYCCVGNGLSNQTFVRGPEGLIAIDTGECVEEMEAALKLLREVTDTPIVACIYTHFHYVSGTSALLQDSPANPIAIYGHAGIDENRARIAGAIAPRATRGMVQQFGINLPEDGPDALLHCGLGLSYRNKDHAPFTQGYIPAHHQFTDTLGCTIAGLQVEMVSAPSDATDSITIWFPELDLVVNNLVWPALFNIYAIRGEAYRDPRVVVAGLDHLLSLAPNQVVGTHGPPLTSDSLITDIQLYRDAIQFIWDQTVRLANRGLSAQDIAQQLVLPPGCDENYLTCEFYGLVEHHVRQVYAGVFGWFSELESDLLPLPSTDRHLRLIQGFGGEASVRAEVRSALDANDPRWALELGTWLVYREGATEEDQALLAEALREVGYTTTSANLRNWTLTRARELEGQLPLDKYRRHRFHAAVLHNQPPDQFLEALAVLVDPTQAAGLDVTLRWEFAGMQPVQARLRNSVLSAQDISRSQTTPDIVIGLSFETWVAVLTGTADLWEAIDEGIVSIEGETKVLKTVFNALEAESLQSAE